MEIHQVLVSASPGDAITNAAFQIRTLLRQVCRSEIYARYFSPTLAHEVLPLDQYDRNRRSGSSKDIICLHASIGEPEVLSFIQRRSERLVVLYHNISPAAPFQEYDPAFAGILHEGRRELAELAPRADMALADSAFNAAELMALGYRDVRVSPLILDVERLLDIEPHEGVANHLKEQVDGPVLLFVGQLLPHKRPDLLLQAYHLLVTYLLPEAYIVLVGTGRLPVYRRALQAFIQELNLPRAWLTGGIADAELAAFYRGADLFVTASEHEGFCVPLIESMAFGVPVLARACGAIPETVDDAGLVLPPDDDPRLLAEAMALLLERRDLRTTFIDRGYRRVEDFAPDKARATLLAHLLDIT